MANAIGYENVTSTSFVVFADALRTTYGDKYIRWYLNGNIEYEYGLYEDVAYDSIEFRGLDPDTEYSVYYTVTYDELTYDESSKVKYITTASEEENTEWTVSEDSWGTIYSSTDESYDFNEYDVVRIKVIFSQSGTATFYSNGASDSRGYLSNSTDFDSEDGRPTSRLEYDSNTSGDFEFTYDVEAGEIYYLFVRHRYEDSSGSFDVYIDPPNADEDHPLPTTDETILTYMVDGPLAAAMIENLNPEYNDVFLVKWTVVCVNTGETILNTETRSDEDSLYYYAAFGITEGYQYSVYVEVHGYPDWININVDTWTSSIYIDAAADTWTVYNVKSWNSISTTQSLDLSLGVGHVNRIAVTFKYSGTAKFYSSGTLDVVGYLSTTSTFNTDSGSPEGEYEYNDDGNDNRQFLISSDVSTETTYYLWVRCYDKTNSGVVTLYIEPPMDNFTEAGAILNASSSSDGTSIIAYISGLDTNYSRSDRSVEWYLGSVSANNFKGRTYISAYASSTSTFSDFGTLTPGTTYQIYAEIYYTSNNITYTKTLGPESVTTANPRPYDFYWDTEKVQGEEIIITADEWTNLQENINLVRKYKGYSEYSFTSVFTGDAITAEVYNECVSAINTISSTSLATVTANQTEISAEVIDNLRIYINNVD